MHPAFWTLGPVTSPGTVCGCGGVPTITLEGTNFHIRNNVWIHGVCRHGTDKLHIGHVGRLPSNPNPNPVPVFATVTCLDRQGNRICRRCEIGGTFAYCHPPGINRFTPCTDANFPSQVTVSYVILGCADSTCC